MITSDTPKGVCVVCRRYIDRLFSKSNLKVRIIYRAPGGHEEVFGAANSNATLEKGGITPEGKFPQLRNIQRRLPFNKGGGPTGGPGAPGLRFGGGLLGLLGLVGEIAGVMDMYHNPDRYKLNPDQAHCNMLGEPLVPGAEGLLGECAAEGPPLA